MRPLVFGNPLLQQQFANDPRNAQAQGMMQAGASTAPVQSWAEAAARALQAPVGGKVLGGGPGAWIEGIRIVDGHVVPVQVRRRTGGGGDHGIEFGRGGHADQDGGGLRS